MLNSKESQVWLRTKTQNFKSKWLMVWFCWWKTEMCLHLTWMHLRKILTPRLEIRKVRSTEHSKMIGNKLKQEFSINKVQETEISLRKLSRLVKLSEKKSVSLIRNFIILYRKRIQKTQRRWWMMIYLAA